MTDYLYTRYDKKKKIGIGEISRETRFYIIEKLRKKIC